MTEADEIYAGLIRQGRFGELLEWFYRDEGENIFNLVLHTIGDHDTAKDVVQDSFIKIHRNVRQLRSPELYRFWAYRITVNTCKSSLRLQQKNRQKLSNSHDEGEFIDESGITPPEQFHNDAVREELQHALSQLTADHRTVLILYYYHDYKYEEIATILSLPMNTVKSHLHRGKQRLLKLLDRKKVEDVL